MSKRPPRRSSRSNAKRKPLPEFRVVLRHEVGQELMGVVRAVMEIAHLAREEATHKMWESYHRGQSPLLVTHLERAELYVEQFAHHGVRVTIEAV